MVKRKVSQNERRHIATKARSRFILILVPFHFHPQQVRSNRATLGEIGNKMWQVRSSRSNISYTDLRLLKVVSYQFLQFCSIVFSTQEKLLDLKMVTSRSFDSGLTEIERIWMPRGVCIPHAPLRSTTPGHHPPPRRKDHWPAPPPPPGNYSQWVGGTYLIVIYISQHHEISFSWEKSAWQLFPNDLQKLDFDNKLVICT